MLQSIFNTLKLFMPKVAFYAVTHVVATRNAISDAVVALVNATGNGQLTLRTVADAEIATLTINTANSVGATDLTFGDFLDDTNATGGTVDHLRIENNTGTEIFRFLPTDITISSTVIGAGDTVQCSSLIYQPPA
ncbi:MAG: hypothetical protein OEQ39_00140 [Gammaproteobacteria bacterium]|nr:hypothetical protein [Gammaproteobacteria bacterium]